MSRGINKAIVLGTLGQDPDVKYTSSGSPVVNLSAATNESWKDKTTGEKQERTEWHRIVIFGKLAEIAAQYLKKGAQVYFEGKIQTLKRFKDDVKEVAEGLECGIDIGYDKVKEGDVIDVFNEEVIARKLK